MPTNVLLVRHGQSTWNAAHRWQGQADPPLSEDGQDQARRAAERLGAFDAVVASDLDRARHTAEIIAACLGIGPVQIDPRLRENDAGEWTGLTHEEIHERWPGWIETSRRPPGFEPREHLVTRGFAALLALGRQYPDGEVLAVSHGGLIRAVRDALGYPVQHFANLWAAWFTVDERDIRANRDVVMLIDDWTPPRSEDESERV